MNRWVNCWMMMTRTKPQYMSMLTRKRSSLTSPLKMDTVQDDNRFGTRIMTFVPFANMCCSIVCGVVLLVLNRDVKLTAENVVVPVVVAFVASFLGGLCLVEYTSSHAQETTSIYSCSYQSSSEVLAFFVGWSWLLSQTAMTAAICKTATLFIDDWSRNEFLEYMKLSFYSHAELVSSLTVVLMLALMVCTGLCETSVWYTIVMPLSFCLVVAACVVNSATEKKASESNGGSWLQVENLNQVLTLSTLCLLFFTGPHTLYRLPQQNVRQKTSTTLGPVNLLIFIVIIATLLTTTHQNVNVQNFRTDSSGKLASNILFCISIFIFAVESFYPLHSVIENMSSDGLLFRMFSKKLQLFCCKVASPLVQLTAVFIIGTFLALLSTHKLLTLGVLFPLMINTIVPVLVLLHRYKDNAAWQYEPMFQTKGKSVRNKSRTSTNESQYTEFDLCNNTDFSTTCVIEESDTDSSETDIDSVVQQYKDQAKIANMATLEELDPNDQVLEPNQASSFKAKWFIGTHTVLVTINAIIFNVFDLKKYFELEIMGFGFMLMSTVFQGLLLCLPQNRNKKSCCKKIPKMPWIPGMASLVSSVLLVHCLIETWRAYLSWLLVGIVIYFGYGIRNSTAANSFHNLQPTHIRLRPIPSYGNKCVTQILPSHRKKSPLKRKEKIANSLSA